ncbi:DUF2201 family putative metallopeptidase [Arenicellales bacterium nBUS_45]
MSAARARLILDRPFLGALVLRLPVEYTNESWCKTIATDAHQIFLNRQYLDGLSLSQIEFALAHEALHCALAHFSRRQHREQHRWDIACDFAVNSLLVNDGLVPVPDALHLSEFDGLSAEEIYPMIEDELDRSTHDGHLYDGQATDENSVAPDSRACGDRPDTPSPLSPMERTKLEQQWQERLAGAAQQALQAGRLSASLARMLNLLITPSVPWRNTLAKFMSMRSRDDFDYARPGRREGDAILPALRSAGIEVVVALDTSGSIAVSEMTEFVSEINALKGQVRARIALLACDSEITPESPEIYEPWETMAIPFTLGGGGGTDFRPVFRWISHQDRFPDLLIYFTDGKGRFPSSPPDYPVLWLVKGPEAPPWGDRIQLN